MWLGPVRISFGCGSDSSSDSSSAAMHTIVSTQDGEVYTYGRNNSSWGMWLGPVHISFGCGSDSSSDSSSGQ